MPELYIIAGCNGAGKTTAAYTLLPEVLQIDEFVNADEIARGLSPFNPESVAFAAGRIMLGRIKQLISERKSFVFESTLATRSYVDLIKKAQNAGYTVNVIFLWLGNIDLAFRRVRKRVAAGGHNIPLDIITRRYYRGLKNLHQLYLPISDSWWIYDNSDKTPAIIAEGTNADEKRIYNEEQWQSLNEI